MINKIEKNEVLIRGMLVARYGKYDRTTVVVCAQDANHEHPNYQHITFFGEQKEIADNIELCQSVTITAVAWIYRDPETKLVNADNMRLRGKSIELTRDFKKRTFAAVGVPIYGLQLKDCVRFAFNGSIVGIKETKNHKVSILLGVSEAEHAGFSIIPLMYSGKGPEDIKTALETYHKGNVISVKGFVSQKVTEEEQDGEMKKKYNNTYFITSFLTSVQSADGEDEIIEE